MCETCGCDQPDEAVKILLPDEEDLDNSADSAPHVHAHQHQHTHARQIDLEQNVLQQNNLLAERNRGFLEALHVQAFNLVSSPGSGKTTLLESTIRLFDNKTPMAVIEGDQQTMNDARRMEATGVPVVQVNTGKGCHLDAHMVLHAIKKLKLQHDSLLFIENVGNLVCPAMFDLGEHTRIVIISTTEGEDKPLKYPYMFASSHVCVINKIDLLPYVNFSVDRFKEYALRINKDLTFFEMSATTGQGLEAWHAWLSAELKVDNAT